MPHLHLPHLPHRPSAPPQPTTSNNTPASANNNKQQVVNEHFSKNAKLNSKSSKTANPSTSSGQPAIMEAAKPSRSSRKSKSPSSHHKNHTSHLAASQHHHHQHNHIADKSSRLNNIFTLKRRHRSNEPSAGIELVESKRTDPESKRPKSLDPKSHQQQQVHRHKSNPAVPHATHHNLPIKPGHKRKPAKPAK